MAQVTVTIDGKAYRMACEEGQEQHLTDLADQFDRYVGHLKGQFGEIGDLRITVMAGIMIMDELSELTRKVGALEGEVQSLKSNRAGAAENQSRSDELVVSALSELSSRLEGLTAKLNGRVPAN
ncbi:MULTISPECIES: cell division protein ZapA [Rhizobium/Agrobacterium group]|jgi:cell division protein ZapA|uniref:Cell division protein ZapA n=1 Tax=Rhizobium soli TaxID=424798 RepID=A0A7X0JKJ5_9HYPH|nr:MULTISPECIES: cell division protein ZapA [Rhizobium/Agrobacterium group]RYE62820.1 MAG: cell division protein ZapA [Rhizobiaceae bacterium]KQQ34356.1 cell division protein ZapA [Rhizobium sp. Leaf306]KQQ71007.1 cell division protein ZapA [Rhizobium sp. Leaf321]MBB6508286.1 cell division protein ZapA [Rhizobium soli]MBD8662236.1 cell division protein ZapA [Rhizobium sp. CFBP 8752]